MKTRKNGVLINGEKNLLFCLSRFLWNYDCVNNYKCNLKEYTLVVLNITTMLIYKLIINSVKNMNLSNAKMEMYINGMSTTSWSPLSLESEKAYTYGDSNRKNKLTSYNGTTITYDQMGNPLSYRNGMTMTWQNGSQFAPLQMEKQVI